jgi:hypothetical protein
MNGKLFDGKLFVVTFLTSGFFVLALKYEEYRPNFINMTYVVIYTYIGRQPPNSKQ